MTRLTTNTKKTTKRGVGCLASLRKPRLKGKATKASPLRRKLTPPPPLERREISRLSVTFLSNVLGS